MSLEVRGALRSIESILQGIASTASSSIPQPGKPINDMGVVIALEATLNEISSFSKITDDAVRLALAGLRDVYSTVMYSLLAHARYNLTKHRDKIPVPGLVERARKIKRIMGQYGVEMPDIEPQISGLINLAYPSATTTKS